MESRQPACDRQEPGVADHPVVRPDTSVTHVPRAPERLEALDVEESVRWQGQDELLELDGGGQVRAEHSARLQRTLQRGERPPRLRDVQHAPVEPALVGDDLGDVTWPQIELIGHLSEERLDVVDRAGSMLVAGFVGRHSPLRPHRTAESDREGARSCPASITREPGDTSA